MDAGGSSRAGTLQETLEVRPESGRAANTRSTVGPIRVVALFLIAFLVTGGLVRAIVPPDPGNVYHPTFTAKQRYFAQTDEHYEVAVVGNSRVVVGFDPVIFDQAFQQAGCSGRSYNLGSVNQSWYEYRNLLSTLQQTPGGTPEVIVSVDTSLFDVGLGRNYQARHRQHMSLGSMADAVAYRSSIPPGEHPDNRFGVASLAAGIIANQFPVGAINQELFGDDPALEVTAAGETDFVVNRQGYEGWQAFRDEAGPEGMANLRATVTDSVSSGEWEARWHEQANPDPKIIDQWVSTIEAHIDPVPEDSLAVHLLMPSFFDRATASAVAQEWESEDRNGHLVNLLADDGIGDFTNPGYWVDWWHVDEPASGEISRATAKAVCSILTEENLS